MTDDDVAPFVAIVRAKLAEGYPFEPAVRAALKGVLISPEFLFLRERPGTLDDFALACRLSYFLWSTMPDDELSSLAARQELGQPDVLGRQVERLLASPKAAAFTENFVGQWLGLREIDATDPSHILYPEFDHLLKVSMIREAELFFDEVLKNDLSLTNFVASDFAMLNGRLARHYGVPGVEGWEFRKTPLPPGTHRGGVLTMAGVLKVTANGTTTSPVTRGAWVLDRILGTPPPPPPDDVPSLDPDTRGARTIREQLAKHRSVESCGACHRKIDPPGFALESFDCIGGWRDHYRSTGNGEPVLVDGRRMPYLNGKKVDPADVTADGDRFENIDDFKQLLLRDKPAIARALATKLVTYATGRAAAGVRPGSGGSDRRRGPARRATGCGPWSTRSSGARSSSRSEARAGMTGPASGLADRMTDDPNRGRPADEDSPPDLPSLRRRGDGAAAPRRDPPPIRPRGAAPGVPAGWCASIPRWACTRPTSSRRRRAGIMRHRPTWKSCKTSATTSR